MNSQKYIKSIIEKEKRIFLFKKTSEATFWDNTIFGLINFILNKDKDYFLITNKRIVYLVKNKLILNSEYEDFSKIKFNSNSDTILFKNNDSKEQKLSLKSLRLSYDEIQNIKKILN